MRNSSVLFELAQVTGFNRGKELVQVTPYSCHLNHSRNGAHQVTAGRGFDWNLKLYYVNAEDYQF